MQKNEVKWNSENFTGDSHGRQPRATGPGDGAGRRGRATGPGDGAGRRGRATGSNSTAQKRGAGITGPSSRPARPELPDFPANLENLAFVSNNVITMKSVRNDIVGNTLIGSKTGRKRIGVILRTIGIRDTIDTKGHTIGVIGTNLFFGITGNLLAIDKTMQVVATLRFDVIGTDGIIDPVDLYQHIRHNRFPLLRCLFPVTL